MDCWYWPAICANLLCLLCICLLSFEVAKYSDNFCWVRVFSSQVDAALGAEEMVESLTEQNLELEEKIEKLETDLSDLVCF